jgi:preprotein translocase subunit SecA
MNALSEKAYILYLITVNDYLARRDARWMAREIYQMLGLSVGVLQMAARTDNGKKAFLVDFSVSSPKEDQDHLRLVSRKEAYDADITYGTNSEFGFDYLRDNMTMNLEDRVQRGHHYAIIDEVDNVLIDEARTPLIISGPASDDVEEYYRMAKVVKQLLPEEYEVSEKDQNVYLTDNGMDHVEELLGMVLRDPNRPEEVTIEQERMMGYLNQALRAEFLYKRNKEYLVQSNKVISIDSFTGRLMPGRRWSNGLHQAIEAKEGVKVEPENVTYATITLQNYYRMYQKIAGMTGTALTEKEEFYKIYLLDVIPIPTNLEYTAHLSGSNLVEKEAKDESGYKYIYYADPKRIDQPLFYKRKDYPDVIYQSEEAKFRAITIEILKNHVIGRPQLIGTASVEHSEYLASRLNRNRCDGWYRYSCFAGLDGAESN